MPAHCGKKAPWVGLDLKGNQCHGGRQAYGPYDYVTERDRSYIVEQYHFGPESENLVKPMQDNFPGDFDYTLRAIPNHHRALLTITRYQIELNKKIKKTQKLLSPVECYFQRAINFSPSDAATQSLYANYLHKIGENQKSDQWYKKAVNLSPDNAKILYSYGLFLIDTNELEQAYKIALEAYKDPKTPPKLKEILIEKGQWK